MENIFFKYGVIIVGVVVTVLLMSFAFNALSETVKIDDDVSFIKGSPSYVGLRLTELCKECISKDINGDCGIYDVNIEDGCLGFYEFFDEPVVKLINNLSEGNTKVKMESRDGSCILRDVESINSSSDSLLGIGKGQLVLMHADGGLFSIKAEIGKEDMLILSNVVQDGSGVSFDVSFKSMMANDGYNLTFFKNDLGFDNQDMGYLGVIVSGELLIKCGDGSSRCFFINGDLVTIRLIDVFDRISLIDIRSMGDCDGLNQDYCLDRDDCWWYGIDGKCMGEDDMLSMCEDKVNCYLPTIFDQMCCEFKEDDCYWDGVCRFVPDSRNCKHAYEECQFGMECCSGICNNDEMCDLIVDDDPCFLDHDCLSGNCNDNKCSICDESCFLCSKDNCEKQDGCEWIDRYDRCLEEDCAFFIDNYNCLKLDKDCCLAMDNVCIWDENLQRCDMINET